MQNYYKLGRYKVQESAAANGKLLGLANGQIEYRSPCPVLIYSHTVVNYHYISVGKTNTAYSANMPDQSVVFPIDFDLLNSTFPAGWEIKARLCCSTNGAVGAEDDLYVKLVDENGVTIGSGTTIGEVSFTLTNGANTKLYGVKTAAFDNGTIPTSGVHVCGLYFRTDSATGKAYFLGDWTIYATSK